LLANQFARQARRSVRAAMPEANLLPLSSELQVALHPTARYAGIKRIVFPAKV
jgi:hypothetical protein